MAAKIGHPYLERDPGAGGRFLKDHPEALPSKVLVHSPCRFHLFEAHRVRDDALKFMSINIDER